MDMEKYLEGLRKLANTRMAHEVEGWCADDSGNYDDIYAIGQRAGEIQAARDTLEILDPNFNLEIEPED